jgi:histidyl-tRNA synthetase
MVPDAEALKVMCDCLVKLDIGDFRVKVNHRGILDGMFEVCGVPADKVRPISSAVDKLDKMAWEDVRKEMVEDKGLDPVVADSIKQYVELKSGSDLDAFITRLEALPEFVANARVKAGLEEMRLLATYLEALGVAQYISFDLSLARGLDYYTGVIYEAVVTSSDARGVGSVASGGRYDNLVGMFSGGI